MHLIIDNLNPDLKHDEKENLTTMLMGNYLGIIAYNFFNHIEFDRNKMKRHFAVLSSRVF